MRDNERCRRNWFPRKVRRLSERSKRACWKTPKKKIFHRKPNNECERKAVFPWGACGTMHKSELIYTAWIGAIMEGLFTSRSNPPSLFHSFLSAVLAFVVHVRFNACWRACSFTYFASLFLLESMAVSRGHRSRCLGKIYCRPPAPVLCVVSLASLWYNVHRVNYLFCFSGIEEQCNFSSLKTASNARVIDILLTLRVTLILAEQRHFSLARWGLWVSVWKLKARVLSNAINAQTRKTGPFENLLTICLLFLNVPLCLVGPVSTATYTYYFATFSIQGFPVCIAVKETFSMS